jgi:HK97 family phage prohead protease
MKLVVKALGTTEALAELRQVRVVVSTGERDRVGDIVVPAGIDFANFLKTRTVLFNHNHDAPIAQCIEISLEGTDVVALVQFPDEGVSDRADEIYGLIRSGVINAASIGFQPHDGEAIDGKDPKKGIRFTRCELTEFSFVSVPANPGATVRERSASNDDKDSSMTVTKDAAAIAARGAQLARIKGLYEVGQLASLLSSLGYVTEYAAWEAECEGDDSKVPARLAQAFAELGAILVDMTAEEVAELLARIAPETSAAAGEKSGPAAVLKAAVASARGAHERRYVMRVDAPVTDEAAARLKSAVEAWHGKPGGVLVLEKGFALEAYGPEGLLKAAPVETAAPAEPAGEPVEKALTLTPEQVARDLRDLEVSALAA